MSEVAERVDIAHLAELLKLKRVVALMAIKDQQPTRQTTLPSVCLMKATDLSAH
jgi:hypothetical protein